MCEYYYANSLYVRTYGTYIDVPPCTDGDISLWMNCSLWHTVFTHHPQSLEILTITLGKKHKCTVEVERILALAAM